MSSLWIIADDYGLGTGHDRMIRSLVAKGAVDAVSVLADACTAESAHALSNVAGPDVCIGLHLNLSYPTETAPTKPDRNFLLLGASIGLFRNYAAHQLRNQRARFMERFGRRPDYIDGHEHCHAFPGIRSLVLSTASEDGVPVRSMVPLAPVKDLKSALVAHLGRRMRRAAIRKGVVTNWRFGGVLPLEDPERAIDRLEVEIAEAERVARSASGDIWFMVHPGDEEDQNQIPGHPRRLRKLEAELLDRLGSGHTTPLQGQDIPDGR